MSSRLLIIGAGEAGRMLAREITSQRDSGYEIVGYLDDDVSLAGTAVDGQPVLGKCKALPRVVDDHNVDEVIIAVPSGKRDFVRRSIRLCRDANVSVKIVPGLLEIIKGPVRLEQIRDMRPEDLLGRESVEFDETDLSEKLSGKSVLVTGAGGSIGSEVCRQIGRFDLSGLFLLGRGENQIFTIEQELGSLYPRLNTVSLIADIRDPSGLNRAFAHARPDYVYHAAAHKHVHYMEAFPHEAVKNNIIGTNNVIGAARECGARRLVMLSTDKAVCPHGVMGASKRFAEYMMMARDGGAAPRLITVRFGNVLASRGSVIPTFIRQIQEGGPVTVSHKDASRFFMSLREACMLVVQASLMGKGGEVFILRMGEPIRIVEIAKDLIALHGLKVGRDVEIEFTGLRPGEKLHEDLTAPGEETVPSEHENILKALTGLPDNFDLNESLDTLRAMAESGDGDAIRKYLSEMIPDAEL